MSDRTCSIYALHSGDGRYFYVGATTVSPHSRLVNHRQRARNGHRSPVYVHMRTINLASVRVVELERVEAEDDLFEREAYWINFLVESGFAPTNEKSRDGVVDSMSDATRRNIGDGNRGRKPWISGKRGVEAGWTAERRRGVSESVVARMLSRVPQHGTANEYKRYLCRCDLCTAASLASHAAYRARRASLL